MPEGDRGFEKANLMPAKSPIELSRVRDIGWSEWDPIGLLAAGDAWDQKPFADEYDAYLLKVAGDLRCGGEVGGAVDYFVSIERDHIGIGVRPGQEARAEATARALKSYMDELNGRELPI